MTVLSAQTTDKRVNAVRPTLFARYPDAGRDGGGRPASDLEEIIGPLGLLPGQDRVAAQARRSAGRAVRRRGAAAARRTWSRCPASAARPPTWCWATPSASPASPSTPTSAGWPAASAGPTRPTRSRSSTRSARCSRKRDWTMLSHHLIWHGRRRCHARNPACGACPVARWCPAYGEGPTDPEAAAKLVTHRGSRVRQAAAAVAVAALALTVRVRPGPTYPCPMTARVDVDTPALRAARQSGHRRLRAEPPRRRRRAAGGHAPVPRWRPRRRPGRPARPDGGEPVGRLVRPVPQGAAASWRSSTTSTADKVAMLGIDYQDTQPDRRSACAERPGVTYPQLRRPAAAI